jgi:hypothetical protein
VTHDEYWEWGTVNQLTGGFEKALASTLLSRGSGLLALDTWVANTDPNNNRNAVFAYRPSDAGTSAFMFIDHAYSLNHSDQWTGEKWKKVSLPSAPKLFMDSIDKWVLGRTLSSIELLADDVIDEIVSRIPADYMVADHSRTVVAGLKGRRALLRPVLEQSLGVTL